MSKGKKKAPAVTVEALDVSTVDDGVAHLSVPDAAWFRFTFDGEKVWRLPAIARLPLSVQLRMRRIWKAKRSESARAEELGELVSGMLDTYAPGLTDILDEAGVDVVMKAWRAHSGLGLGESSASAG